MAKMHRLHAMLLTALALWKHCLAEWNVTDGSSNQTTSTCQLHGRKDNCTAEKDTEQMDGHLSKCPEAWAHYCVHGECRYIKEQETPSCRCQSEYIGARCEYVHLDWLTGGRQQIIIGCSIAGLIFLMILVISICVCSHRKSRLRKQRRRQKEEPKDGTEKHSILDERPTDSTELRPYSSV